VPIDRAGHLTCLTDCHPDHALISTLDMPLTYGWTACGRLPTAGRPTLSRFVCLQLNDLDGLDGFRPLYSTIARPCMLMTAPDITVFIADPTPSHINNSTRDHRLRLCALRIGRPLRYLFYRTPFLLKERGAVQPSKAVQNAITKGTSEQCYQPSSIVQSRPNIGR
jgi:hypothetical protein